MLTMSMFLKNSLSTAGEGASLIHESTFFPQNFSHIFLTYPLVPGEKNLFMGTIRTVNDVPLYMTYTDFYTPGCRIFFVLKSNLADSNYFD